MASRRRVAGAIKSLVNDRDLQLECLVLHEKLLVPVLMYSSETMLQKEKEKSSYYYYYLGRISQQAAL